MIRFARPRGRGLVLLVEVLDVNVFQVFQIALVAHTICIAFPALSAIEEGFEVAAMKSCFFPVHTSSASVRVSESADSSGGSPGAGLDSSGDLSLSVAQTARPWSCPRKTPGTATSLDRVHEKSRTTMAMTRAIKSEIDVPQRMAKCCRRIATRYEKLTIHFPAVVWPAVTQRRLEPLGPSDRT